MRKPVVLVVLLTLVAAGCAKKPSAAKGEHPTITIDGKTSSFVGGFTAYFPNVLTVHPGASITWKLPHFSGEPHTVTLGTLANDGVAALEKLGPQATINQQEDQLLKLPDVFFHEPTKGPPVPNQDAAQPCFLDTGLPPGDSATGTPAWFGGGQAACPKRAQPAFTGKETFYNSGLLVSDGASFTAKLAKDIAPGTYSYMCMVHRGGMTGKIKVVPASQSVPSGAANKKLGTSQFDDLVKKLTSVATQTRKAAVDKAVAGAGSQDVFNALVAEFGPKDISIPVGGTVSWTVFLFHTIAFNPPEDAIGLLTKNADGSFAFNPKSGPAINSPPLPDVTQYFPPPADAKPLTINGGPWDGTAFRSSGLLGSVPPLVITYSTTFTKAGTYTLRCLVHPDMKGTVKVG